MLELIDILISEVCIKAYWVELRLVGRDFLENIP